MKSKIIEEFSMRQKKIKSNQARIQSRTYAVITDKLSLVAESVYNLIRSLDGWEEFDLSTRQIKRYYENRNIRITRKTIIAALAELEALGVIYLEEEGGGSKSNVYQIDDEKFAVLADPNRKYNKQRPKMWKLDPEKDHGNNSKEYLAKTNRVKLS